MNVYFFFEVKIGITTTFYLCIFMFNIAFVASINYLHWKYTGNMIIWIFISM